MSQHGWGGRPFDWGMLIIRLSSRILGGFVQVTMKDRIPVDAFVLDEAEVDAVRYIKYNELEEAFLKKDPAFVPADLNSTVRTASILLVSLLLHSTVLCARRDPFAPKEWILFQWLVGLWFFCASCRQ